MSHLVCACAAPVARSAAARTVAVLIEYPSCDRGILAQFVEHGAREGEARGQSGRLDAEHVHQARHAVLARALYMEVRCGLARAGGLRADAGIAGRERVVRERGPVAADGGIEALRAPGVHVVVDAIHP